MSKSLVVRRRLAASLVLSVVCLCAAALRAADRVERDLSGPGWSLWLDREATWKNDKLFFPVPALSELPVNPPTGGWDALVPAKTVPVAVPGTVEEYLQTKPGPEGDLTGVSWWFRTIELPAWTGARRVYLRFESMRLRAEVFVNRKLVGYDVVGNSPVEVDITSAVEAGRACEIAVRITDPAGNFDWRDSSAMRWGEYSLPMSHGFGGITGRVRLVMCSAVNIADLSVQNSPAITEARALVALRNTTGVPMRRTIDVRVVEKSDPAHEVARATSGEVDIPADGAEVPVKISAPDAKKWDVENPNLYVCEATLRDKDAVTDTEKRTFGFRWFAPDGIGTDAMLRLNGHRIVLRTAISWGFWPTNGIFPTEALAEKQVRVAKEMGLNMLNFHRAIGSPVVFEKADELGLLYFEEPGAYKSADRDPFGHALSREKWLRMVHRDRSHPSLAIYNLINEWDSRNPNPDPVEIARHRDDMQAAHAIDPSRLILHTSAWARGKDIDDPAKLHFRPFDDTAHLSGWYDVHHAGGPATWNEGMYRSPTDYYGVTDDTREVVFWGEEGALSTPPRLEKIVADLDKLPHQGWDGDAYRAWYRTFDEFLTKKNLRGAFKSVDAFSSTMGNISMYHQGRRIENMRLGNVADGYAINGWEAEVIENHSGVVDCFRNPKGDPAIMAYYNKPLYVAVKLRNTVVTAQATVTADFFAINERNLHGAYTLRIALQDAGWHKLVTLEKAVTLKGGDVYGELLAAGVAIDLPAGLAGSASVDVVLVDTGGNIQATGHDALWIVEPGEVPASKGAVWESGTQLAKYFGKDKAHAVPAYTRDLSRLDWLVAARAPLEGEPGAMPAEVLQQADGAAGLKATFFSDQRFTKTVHERVDAVVRFSVDDGAAPDPALGVMTNYAVRWEGRVVPPQDGTYTFAVRTNGRVRLVVGETTVIEPANPRSQPTNRGTIALRAGVAVPIRLEYFAGTGAAQCSLEWVVPDADATVAVQLIERVKRDGMNLVVLERADAWMALLAKEPGATFKYEGSFKVGKTWLGGVHFVRDHPLFRGLPVNAAMDWAYQSVVRNGDERVGLVLDGEELAAGCYHSFPMQLGTAVGVVPLGKGHVIFSTLDIVGNLNSADGPAAVARKLLSNYLLYTGQ